MMKTLKQLPEEILPAAQAPAWVRHGHGAPILTYARAFADFAPPSRTPRLERGLRQRITSPATAARTSVAPLIYAVDDLPDLTKLYTIILEANGYVVKAFSDRAKTLAALKAEQTNPDLLITDYLGLSMPVDEFIRHCLAIHPCLRILMASGFHQIDARVTDGQSNLSPTKFYRARQ